MALRWLKIAQDGSKMALDGSKMVQDGSKMAQDGSKMVQDGSKMAQDGSKMAQDSGRLKTSKRWPHRGLLDLQDSPKTAPRHAQDSPKTAHGVDDENGDGDDEDGDVDDEDGDGDDEDGDVVLEPPRTTFDFCQQKKRKHRFFARCCF